MSTACATCHEDFHKGRLGPNCQSCHNFVDWKIHQRGPVRPFQDPLSPHRAACAGAMRQVPHQRSRRQADATLGIPFDKCADCHQDPHHGGFPQGCQPATTPVDGRGSACSPSTSELRPLQDQVSALEGKHATVECAPMPRQRRFQEADRHSQKCTDCHKDAHNGQFLKRPDRGECSACHNVQGWKPSTFHLKAHASTEYPLEGGHAQVECMQCHTPKGKDTLYKVKFERCTDCHDDDTPTSLPPLLISTLRPVPQARGIQALNLHPGQAQENPVCADWRPCGRPVRRLPQGIWPSSSRNQPPSITGKDLNCTSCHNDPHKGQFKERMEELRARRNSSRLRSLPHHQVLEGTLRLRS